MKNCVFINCYSTFNNCSFLIHSFPWYFNYVTPLWSAANYYQQLSVRWKAWNISKESMHLIGTNCRSEHDWYVGGVLNHVTHRSFVVIYDNQCSVRQSGYENTTEGGGGWAPLIRNNCSIMPLIWFDNATDQNQRPQQIWKLKRGWNSTRGGLSIGCQGHCSERSFCFGIWALIEKKRLLRIFQPGWNCLSVPVIRPIASQCFWLKPRGAGLCWQGRVIILSNIPIWLY